MKSCFGKKGLFRLQERTMRFNITEYKKFTGMALHTTLHLTFKNQRLLGFISVERGRCMEDQGRVKEELQV